MSLTNGQVAYLVAGLYWIGGAIKNDPQYDIDLDAAAAVFKETLDYNDKEDAKKASRESKNLRDY